jgi:hypothetical protein
VENLSKVIMPLPWPVEIHPYLFDHHSEGRCLLPAVEALIILAGAVKKFFSKADLGRQSRARFPRFLVIPPETRRIETLVKLEPEESGGCTAELLTRVISKSGGIGRHLTHARVEFNSLQAGEDFSSETGMVQPSIPEMTIQPSSIYRELIPFGPAYQNIASPAALSREGVWADLSGGGGPAAEASLGSPFPLDAAFHLACLWGQRFSGIVPFPTGFERRIIHRKTEKGERYSGWVTPTSAASIPLLFDVLIFDQGNTLCEEIHGLQMQDVSQGRLRPPSWLRASPSDGTVREYGEKT